MTEPKTLPIDDYRYRLNNLLSKFWEFTPFSESNPLPTMLCSKNEDGTLNFSYCPKPLEEESPPSKVSCLYIIQHDGKVKVEESKEVLDLNEIAQTFAIIATIITDLYGPFDAESAHKKLMQKELPNIFKKDDTDLAIEFYDSGQKKTEEGDYKGAIEDFSKAIELDAKTGINKESSKLYFIRGFVKVKTDDFEGGIIDLSKAIEIDPNYTLAYDNRGFAKNKLKDNKGAIEDYDKAIELNPNEVNTYLNRANAKSDLGEPFDAYDDCTKAIELNPKSFNAYFNRACVWKIVETYDAIDDYSKALEIDPMHSNSYFLRGEIYFEEKRFKEALNDFNKVIEIGTDPCIADIYIKRGLTKKELGDLTGACDDWKEAADLGDDDAEDLLEEHCK